MPSVVLVWCGSALCVSSWMPPAQTYMSHLAEYYDPSEEEADNVQPFLRELQHSVDEHHGHIVQLDIEQDEPELSLIAGCVFPPQHTRFASCGGVLG